MGSNRQKRRSIAGFAALVALAVLALGVAGFALLKTPAGDPRAATFTPQPLATTQVRTRPLAVMIGDSFTAGNDETPGALRYGFVDRAVDSLGWDKFNLAQGGTGYVNPGADQSTRYSGVVDRAVRLDPDILLVGGGINDSKYPAADVRAAADSLYKDLKAKLPKTKIVVLGPVTPGGAAGEYRGAVPVRDALRDTAQANSLPFIDPIAEDWMPTKDGLVGPTNFHPNEAGHKMLSIRLGPELERLGLT